MPPRTTGFPAHATPDQWASWGTIKDGQEPGPPESVVVDPLAAEFDVTTSAVPSPLARASSWGTVEVSVEGYADWRAGADEPLFRFVTKPETVPTGPNDDTPIHDWIDVPDPDEWLTAEETAKTAAEHGIDLKWDAHELAAELERVAQAETEKAAAAAAEKIARTATVVARHMPAGATAVQHRAAEAVAGRLSGAECRIEDGGGGTVKIDARPLDGDLEVSALVEPDGTITKVGEGPRVGHPNDAYVSFYRQARDMADDEVDYAAPACPEWVTERSAAQHTQGPSL